MQKYADKPFVLLGVNSDQDPQKVADLEKAGTVTWTSFFQGGTRGPISQRWGVNGWPSVFVIDHEGIVRHMFRGTGQVNEHLDEAIEALLAGIG